MLSTVAITNLFEPDDRTRQVVRVPLDPGVDLARASRVLLVGVMSAEGPLAQPPPDVLLDSVTMEGLFFSVRCRHSPELSVTRVRHQVLYSVMGALQGSGIPTARMRHEIVRWEAPEAASLHSAAAEVQPIMSRVELFQAFENHQLAEIAWQAKRLEVEAGEEVVRQGEPGNSMFFVGEGLLEV